MTHHRSLLGIKGASIDQEKRFRAPLNSLLDPKLMMMHATTEEKVARKFANGTVIGPSANLSKILTVTNSNSNIKSTSSLLLGNLKEKFVKDAELKKMKNRHTD